MLWSRSNQLELMELHSHASYLLGSCGITNGALVAVAAFCPVLHALSVSGVKSISDQGIVRIAMVCIFLGN